MMPSKRDCYNGVRVYRCRSFAEIASAPLSASFLARGRKETKDADIVVSHFPYPMTDLGILMGLFGGKLVVWWHCDFDTQKGRILTKLYTPLVKNTLKKADAIIVSAKGNITGSRILRKFRHKCHVISFAVSDEIAAEGRAYCAKKHGEEAGRKTKVHVIFIGRFVWYKGLDILLKAFSRLDRDLYELVLVGDGPLAGNMKKLAEELRLGNVRFAGAVSEKEKRDWLKWCDFLVLPSVSKAEAFAIVQIEAMAFGKPVINTWIPSGVPDICPNGVSGITVNPRSEKELAEAIQKLGEDRKLREQLGERGFRLVEEKYSRTYMVKQYIRLFQSITNQEKR